MLNKKAVLIQMSISTWDGKTVDKTAEQTVAEKFSVDARVGRYRKQLIHDGKHLLDAVHQASGSIRSGHYKRTASWNEGEQILPTKAFWDYQRWLSSMKPSFEKAREEFLQEYAEDWPRFALAQQPFLKNLWNIQDYPIPSAMAEKFSLAVSFRPVPAAGDFRVELDDETLDSIKADLEASCAESLKESMKDIWRRLFCAIQKIHAKLSIPVGQEGGIFRNSLIENAQELIELLPGLNVADDPNLDALLEEIRGKITCFTPDALRESVHARSKAAEEAEKVLEKIKGYF